MAQFPRLLFLPVMTYFFSFEVKAGKITTKKTTEQLCTKQNENLMMIFR